jgi:hypothetical protein
MLRFKPTIFAVLASAALACVPIRPAAAAGPLLFAPWALGHIVLPLLVGAAAAAAQPQASYAPGPGYYGGAPANYAPPGYYPPPVYYAQSPGYPQPYYRSSLGYATPMPHSYAPPRGYYPARPSYYAPYGGHTYHRSGGFGYRHR